MCKTAWMISLMSRNTLRSGKPSSKRDYHISNEARAATRAHNIGTWTGLVSARCGIWQEEWCPMDFRDHRPQRGFGRSERSLMSTLDPLDQHIANIFRRATLEREQQDQRLADIFGSPMVPRV